MNTLRCLSTFFSARRSSDSTYSRYSMSSTISTYSRFSIYISPSGQSITKHTHLTVTVHEVLCEMFFSAPGEPLTRCKTMSNKLTFVIAGGHITCNQCQAMSKRSRQRCKAPALKGKAVCRTHGGLSTGCKTEAGRQRCAEAKTIHGRESRKVRSERSLASGRLAVLEAVGFSIGLMSGSRSRGRRPDRMAESYPQLQALLALSSGSSGVVKQHTK